MATKHIFIASSREQKPLAAKIAQTLADDKTAIARRWWEEFRPNDITWERLIEISTEVDGAVFIFAADDKLWFRGNSHDVPRDNCILEFGLFSGSHDRKRLLIVSDQDTKLPSDLAGLSVETLNRVDIAGTAERVRAYFANQFVQPALLTSTVHFVIDPVVRDAQIRPPPPQWISRLLYLGDVGAAHWIDVAHDPKYPANIFNALTHQLTAAAKVDARTIVSLGPGVGDADIHIVRELRKREPWVEYIPVDICGALVQESVTRLKEIAPVPVAIVADFEEDFPFIAEEVGKASKGPRLFSLIGATVGNLDRRELNFFSGLRDTMNPGDTVLLDVGLAGPNWSDTKEPRLSHATYEPPVRAFLATGISRRTKESEDAIVSAFDQRLGLESIDKQSDVAGTRTIRAFDRNSNMTVLLNRRYTWDAFIAFLETSVGLKIVHGESIFDDSNSLGMGFIVAEKANT